VAGCNPVCAREEPPDLKGDKFRTRSAALVQDLNKRGVMEPTRLNCLETNPMGDDYLAPPGEI
jgi:hypothetical protein